MIELLILTSPPASGKTFWIKSYQEEIHEDLLVISPLRALADECRSRWGESVTVMTPEEWLIQGKHHEVVIFDEFHLLTYWGDTFRPRMWEAFEDLCGGARLVIGLTATFSPELVERVELFSCHFDRILWADYGNMKLKYQPDSYVRLTGSLMEKTILNLPPRGTSLIFCRYREEVLEWEKRLQKDGHRSWSCRGGEAPAFRKRVELESAPDYIISTTVLSHGVNLPVISRIFFLYPVKNIDFWIQMTARGGRTGEKFEVFALEPPHGLRWGRFSNLVSLIFLHTRLLKGIFLNQLEQCFLKD